jgi:ATP-dependent Zn protease
MRQHRTALERLAERLLEAETLDRTEVEALLKETMRGGKALRAAAV